MTAEVVTLPSKRRVLEVVNADEEHVRPPDPRSLAIEECADRIERGLGERLTIDQRIGLERALDALVSEVEWRRREPW